MKNISPVQAIGLWLLLVFILYIIGAVFSFSFSIDNWNGFSKIIFFGPSVIIGIWTINDYFLNPKK